MLNSNLSNLNESKTNGLTPPIDGEYFTLKRSYSLRPSTLRKLNIIKANHENINIYMNTIIDSAINYYYENKINK